MSRILTRGSIAAVVALVLVAGPASAHEARKVGAYQLEVGWQHEPTYAGTENGVAVFIHDATGAAVDSLGDPPTLKVVVSTGSQTSDPLELTPSFDADTGDGTHGEFDAPLIPTAVGVYTFHFTGTINGQSVDERFTSSDTTFDSVKAPTEVEFPSKDPTAGELAGRITRLTPRVTSAAALAKSAKDKGDSASTLALVALIAGVGLGGAGLVVGLTGRRRST